MKRQVLFIGYDSVIQDEISEFLRDRGGRAWFSDTSDRSIRFLEEHPINVVVLSMHSLSDASIIHYINSNFPHIQVIVSTNPEYEEIIAVLSKRNFLLLHQPLKLKELGGFIE